MQGDLKCLSVGPSVRLSPSVPVGPSILVIFCFMQFYDSTHPKGTRGTCQRPGGWKSKSRIWVFFVEGTPAIELFVLIVLHKTNLLVTLSHKLSFFCKFLIWCSPEALRAPWCLKCDAVWWYVVLCKVNIYKVVRCRNGNTYLGMMSLEK